MIDNNKHDLLEMPVYRLACELKRSVLSLIARLENRELRSVRSQTLGAVTSISANIAEAYGRFGFRDRVQFLYVARGSAWELIDHLGTVALVNQQEAAACNDLDKQVREVIRQLNAYIASLRRQGLKLKGKN